MIGTQATQVMIARTSIRSAASVSRGAGPLAIVSRQFLSTSCDQLHRSFTTVVPHHQQAAVVTPVIDVNKSEMLPQASIPAMPTSDRSTSKSEEAKPSGPAMSTSGRSKSKSKSKNKNKEGKPSTTVGKVKQLLKWTWFDPDAPQRAELAAALREGSKPEWLESKFELAKSFRSARARLWTPTAEEIQTITASTTKVADAQAWLDQQLETYRAELQAKDLAKQTMDAESASPARVKTWDMMEPNQQIDLVLRPFWQKLSVEQRQIAMVRVRYECIRKLGWRQGYSSGYPRPEEETDSLPKNLGKQGPEGLAAFKELQRQEEELAWTAWKSMPSTQRVVEEKAAWTLRDRSQLYLDDSEDSLILGSQAPRWYDVPERAGQLTFLPNTIIRLVKNHTPAGQEYDPWKATFRVPLNMHKHGLRTYLLAIYGLKTTWARSMIYRSPNTRDTRTGEKITGRGRTHKKVEVGLLEPFLFPEVSPDFQKQYLLTSELEFERARTLLKMTKTNRWRGKKSVEQVEQEIKNREQHTFHGLDPSSSEGIESPEQPEFPRFIVKTKGLPSAKRGKILQFLGEERKKREERINALIQKFKEEHSATDSSEKHI